MKPFWPFTRKLSETSEALRLAHELTATVKIQAEANIKLTEKMLDLAREKDSQIRMVLESKFQPFVQMMPPRVEQPRTPESFEHLSDVNEMSEEAAEAEVERATRREKAADEALMEALQDEFIQIAEEHAEAHGHKVEA